MLCGFDAGDESRVVPTVSLIVSFDTNVAGFAAGTFRVSASTETPKPGINTSNPEDAAAFASGVDGLPGVAGGDPKLVSGDPGEPSR